jgi:hypothetical protein
MVLPIIVTAQTAAPAALRVYPNTIRGTARTQVRFSWKHFERPSNPESRPKPKPLIISARQRLVTQRWMAIEFHLGLLDPTPQQRNRPRPAPIRSSLPPSAELLRECESLLGRFIRRSWAASSRHHQECLVTVTRRFIPNHACTETSAVPSETAALILASMYWRGCRHPDFLCHAPQHPSTGLVRWLTRFNVIEQHEQQREIQTQLLEEFNYIGKLCTSLVSLSNMRFGKTVYLPELVNLAQNRRFAE